MTPAACEETRRALLGGPAAHARAHAQACPSCRRYVAELRARPGLLRALAPPLAPEAGSAMLARLRAAFA